MTTKTDAEQLRAEFEAWLRVKPCGAAHDFAWEAWRARAALQSQPRQPEISRDLLGRIVDQVFDGAIEDTTAIEDIYRVIAREFALQSQDREDAERYRWLLEQAWFQEAFDRFDPDDGGSLPRFVSECARIIDHARRIEGEGK